MNRHSKTLSSARRSAAGKLALLGGLLLAVFLLSFCLGRYGVPLGQVVRVLLYRLGAALGGLLDRLPGVEMGPLFPLAQTWTDQMETVVIQIRLPRIAMASGIPPTGLSLTAPERMMTTRNRSMMLTLEK